MKLKVTLATLALLLTPTFAVAFTGCSGYGHDKQSVSSCIEGYAWDTDAGACVKKATS